MIWGTAIVEEVWGGGMSSGGECEDLKGVGG
jgi:hypothetical protein